MQRGIALFVIAVLSLASAAAGAADIYGYVDAAGVEHFSDVPDSPQYRLVLSDGEKLPTGQRRSVYADAIGREAAAMNLDPLLLDAIIHVESRHNPNAISPRGARGLMQLMPATAQRYGVADSLQADANIRGGTQYLRDLSVRFQGDLRLMLAAYNAGEGAVLRHDRKIPPYAETQRYVADVLRRYDELRRQK